MRYSDPFLFNSNYMARAIIVLAHEGDEAATDALLDMWCI